MVPRLCRGTCMPRTDLWSPQSFSEDGLQGTLLRGCTQAQQWSNQQKPQEQRNQFGGPQKLTFSFPGMRRRPSRRAPPSASTAASSSTQPAWPARWATDTSPSTGPRVRLIHRQTHSPLPSFLMLRASLCLHCVIPCKHNSRILHKSTVARLASPRASS